jgi:hypothetical protein
LTTQTEAGAGEPWWSEATYRFGDGGTSAAISVPNDVRFLGCVLFLRLLPPEAWGDALTAIRDIYEDWTAASAAPQATSGARASFKPKWSERQSMPVMPIGE